MGYSINPNGSDLSIVTVVLQYSVFASEYRHSYQTPSAIVNTVYLKNK